MSCDLVFFRARTSRRKQNTAGFRIRKARFFRYLWRRGFNWKVTLHVHPGAISGSYTPPPQGAPWRYISHELPSYVSCGGKQRGANTLPRRVDTTISGRGVRISRQKLGESKTKYNLPPSLSSSSSSTTTTTTTSSSPGGKQHCLTSAIRDLTEQYWRLEAAAATAFTGQGGNLFKLSLYWPPPCVSFSPGLTPGRVRGNEPDAPHKFPKLWPTRRKAVLLKTSVNSAYRSAARSGLAPLLCLDINPGSACAQRTTFHFPLKDCVNERRRHSSSGGGCSSLREVTRRQKGWAHTFFVSVTCSLLIVRFFSLHIRDTHLKRFGETI